MAVVTPLLGGDYPIHPELFRRLYDDWSTLDKFQRTRGVLRLLAKVIHRLWEGQDNGLLIMPASVSMDDHAIKSELTRYLPDVWEPIISQDVDGPNSMPLSIDQEVRHLGRYSACRRVARALYIGTAPGADSDAPGVGAERIRLACAQPGETVATFGDALRRVSEKGEYIHQDGNRYWISTRPNINQKADDRAAQLMREPEELYAEIVRRLESDRTRGDFADYDEASGRYLGLRTSEGAPPAIDNRTCLVKVDVARKQMEEDAKKAPPTYPEGADGGGGTTGAGGMEESGPDGTPTPPGPAGPTRPTTFVGSVKIDGARVGRDAARIADEVLAHLAALPGAELKVTLEVHVLVAQGVTEDVVRVVSENANALKFDHASFERD
jgi:hypothetical protein